MLGRKNYSKAEIEQGKARSASRWRHTRSSSRRSAAPKADGAVEPPGVRCEDGADEGCRIHLIELDGDHLLRASPDSDRRSPRRRQVRTQFTSPNGLMIPRLPPFSRRLPG